MTAKFIILQRVPGMNGKDGLLREHWSKRKKRKDMIKRELLAQVVGQPKFKDKVRVQFTNYCSSHPMDWDNFCASFKLIGDSLTDLRIIKDDSPLIIVEFLPKQVKSERKDERIEILIEEVK